MLYKAGIGFQIKIIFFFVQLRDLLLQGIENLLFWGEGAGAHPSFIREKCLGLSLLTEMAIYVNYLWQKLQLYQS